MQQSIQAIQDLLQTQTQFEDVSINYLPQSGSDRQYFRILHKTGSMIGTYGLNVQENNTFIYFSKHLPVPTIIAQNEAGTAYLQTDLGTTSLLDHLLKDGYCEPVKDLFKKSL